MQAPPLVEGNQHLIEGYVIRLPFPMARRAEEGSLVFWHSPKGLTLWISAVQREKDAGDPLPEWREQASKAAYDEIVEHDSAALRFGYRLAEEDTDAKQPAFYGYFAEGRVEFLVTAYFDSAERVEDAHAAWRSIRLAA